jgi:hypothetical protein
VQAVRECCTACAARKLLLVAAPAKTTEAQDVKGLSIHTALDAPSLPHYVLGRCTQKPHQRVAYIGQIKPVNQRASCQEWWHHFHLHFMLAPFPLHAGKFLCQTCTTPWWHQHINPSKGCESQWKESGA